VQWLKNSYRMKFHSHDTLWYMCVFSAKNGYFSEISFFLETEGTGPQCWDECEQVFCHIWVIRYWDRHWGISISDILLNFAKISIPKIENKHWVGKVFLFLLIFVVAHWWPQLSKNQCLKQQTVQMWLMTRQDEKSYLNMATIFRNFNFWS
jgi:hypothetical protein